MERKGGNKYTIFLDIKVCIVFYFHSIERFFEFLQNLTASDSGVYKCTLSNELGTAVANIVIKVAGR